MAGEHYDLIVVGLGAVGSAALYHAARAGHRVLGIDRHRPPHPFGSSHAESRVTRLVVGEGPQYVPFVARSHEIWRELEAEAGVELFHQCGGYIVNPAAESADARWGSFVQKTSEVAARSGLDFAHRSPGELMAAHPNVILDDSMEVGYEPTAGVVMCERAIETQLRLAEMRGAQTVFDQPVTSVTPTGEGAVVATADATYEAAAVIVCAGAWFADLAPSADASAVKVTRQVVYFFEVDDPAAWSTDVFSWIIWAGHSIEEYSGVFPIPPGGNGALKVLGEQFDTITTPAEVDRTVHEHEIDEFYERIVRPHLRGVRRETRETSVCLYTNTADDHFLIDHHPESDRILYASPCSGHGFKHSTGLAEAMVQRMTTGSSTHDLAPFARRTTTVL